MKFLPDISYPESEQPKLAALENLFREWHQHFASNASALERHEHVADGMVFDGFYPHYFSQKKKLLFIGREALEIEGFNYLELLFDVYRNNKYVGDLAQGRGQHLNRSKFHSRMLYVAYGILNGMPLWQEIPYANEIGDTFGDANGISFAFMNISKLSNESGIFLADWPVINAAYELSTQGRNFIQEEIAILEPDIIVTMNLMDDLKDGLDSLGKWDRIDSSHPGISVWCLGIGHHRSLVIDTWHFSNWKKDGIADYYVPICDAIRESESSFNA